ncbi:hypothetical protein D770_16815 [Flammeovirgaceae bacterium 311]|nr:hypothetical protein D770_16815 [Flammeovirgaceae bacterium 311]
MEGVATEDTANLSATDDHFLAADLTEYHGGCHFVEADRVIICQLKYSTRHPDKAWTKGRLRQRKGENNSVIERLAASYQDLIDAGHSRAEIQQKVRLRLISNQPLHHGLKDFWLDTQSALLAMGPGQINLTQLRDTLHTKHHIELNKFFRRVGFSEVQFTDFFRILDFSDCGVQDRLGQRLSVLQELAPSIPTGEKDSYLRLTDLVRQQALPENQHAAPLVQDDILAQLQVFSKKNLFPEPAAFNYPDNPVPTTEAATIAAHLLRGSNQHFIAHGEAGVGKTTTVQQVQSHLPAGSVTVLYDCYADGTYYNLSTGRHTLKNSLLQLSNELAVATGLPFLVRAPSDKYELIDYFQLRLNAAAKFVEATGGLLVLAIDAADNSIVKGYKDPGSNCFVPYLWELKLPSNCRLLMTSRTHRKDSLMAPSDTVDIELTGFDIVASALRLRQVFPEASDKSVAAFHQRTGGNPRVQEYWLDSGPNLPGSYAAFLHSFRRKSTTASAIIEDIVRSAVVEVPDPEQAQEQLATLVCLQRLIPISVFALASNITIDQATAFCHALKPGLVLENELIGFRDEDFETQLRVRPETAGRLHATHERLGDFFLPLAAQDEYAAQAVAEHFSAADRHRDLIQLALNGPSVAFIPDSALRLRVERRRLRLALQAAATLRNDMAGAKIAILAAETLRANATVKSLVKADIELAAHFGNTDNVADYFHASADDAWLGSVHYRLAAYYASTSTQHAAAKRHLAHGLAWVRRYMRRPKHERQHWEISDLDITCEIEAYYWLQNPMVAYERLQRWRPVQVHLRVLHTLLGRLSAVVPLADLEAQLRHLNLPLLGQCTAQAALWRFGYPVSKEWCEEVAERLLPILSRKKIKPVISSWRFDDITEFAFWPLHLAELFTHHQFDSEVSLMLLEDLLPAFPSHAAGKHSTYSELVIPIRVVCIRAYLRGQKITGLELFPPPMPKEGERSYSHNSSYENAEYRKDLDRFISIYAYRAELLNTSVSVTTVEKVIRSGLDKIYPTFKSSDITLRHRQAQWLRSAISLTARVADAEYLLEQLADKAQVLVGRELARQLWLHIADETIGVRQYQAFAYQCLERAASDAEEADIPVKNRWPILVECAQKSRLYEEEFSRDFYRRAIEAAHQGVGADVAYRLSVGAQVASQLNSSVTLEEGYDIGICLSALVEAYQPYMSDEDAKMPLDDTLSAVTKLHPSAGIALCLRWDVMDIVRIEDGVASVAKAATKRDFWHPAQSLWLLKLCGESFDISGTALALLDNLPSASVEHRRQSAGPLSAVASWVAKDVPINRRLGALKRIISWANAHQHLQLPAIKNIQEIIDFVESAVTPMPALQPAELSEYEIERQTQKEEWDAAALQGDISAFVKWQDELQFHHEEMVPAILKLASRVIPSKRSEVLELLVKVRRLYGSRRDVALDALQSLLHEWKTYGPVQAWVEKELPRFFSRNITHLTGEGELPPHLEQLCSLPLVNSSRASLLLPGIADELDLLGPEHLCRVAAALTKTSDTSALKEFINWHLSRIKAQLIADKKTLPFIKLLPTTDPSLPRPSTLIAQFIWALCGHPDKRVRWRAIHAARQLLMMPENAALRKDFIDELMRLSMTKSSLLPEAEEFYWQGARVWVLVLLDRVADEFPEEVHLHLDSIKHHVFDPSFPHAQIRELARGILIKLHKYNPAYFSGNEIERIRFSNRPKGCLVTRGYRANADEVRPAIKRSNQFEFNQMDTVDYWFRPLARVFGQSKEKITALVEYWICEKWGRLDTECQMHRLNDSKRYDWGLLSHYKLSDTTVDNLRMHLTHHALMCVAGELADSFPMCIDTYTEPTSAWEEWLERYLPNAGSDAWLAEWRNSTPLRAECWGKLPEPWHRKPYKQYCEALGFSEPNRQGWIILHGHHKFGAGEPYGDVYVSSVQVAPEASLSLLWALQPVKSNDYAFPTFGLADSDDELPDELPTNFSILPLLKEKPKNYGEGLEKHDTAAHGVHSTYPLLSDDFVARCSLTVAKDGKEYYDTEGSLAAECEVWDDDLGDKHSAYNREAYSTGHRIWMRYDILQRYITLTGKKILFQVTLSRNNSTNSYSQQKRKYDLGKRRLALLHQDGTFETVAGKCSPWPTHSSRA